METIPLALVEPLHGTLSYQEKPPKTKKITDPKDGVCTDYSLKEDMSRVQCRPKSEGCDSDIEDLARIKCVQDFSPPYEGAVT